MSDHSEMLDGHLNLLLETERPDLVKSPVVDALRPTKEDLDKKDQKNPQLLRDLQRLSAGVIELFERARQLAAAGKIDLIILSARRLACLYQLAIEKGLPPIDECPVVSDRFLDVAGRWRWQHVLIGCGAESSREIKEK